MNISYEYALISIGFNARGLLLLEVPTGAFADIFGKKITLVILFLTYSLALLAYTISSSFMLFIVLEVIKGFAKSMYSGSFEAMVYDTLLEENKEKEYDHIISDFTSLAWIALFISSFTGGFLFKIYPTFPYIATAIVYILITLIFIFYTKEPVIDSKKYDFSLKNYIFQNLRGFRELFPNLKVATISLFIIIISFSYQMTSEFLGLSQAKAYGIKPEYVGILFGTAYIFSAPVSQSYKRLKKIFSDTILLSSYLVIALLSLIFANVFGAVVGGALLLLRISFSTIYLNSKSVILNSTISSKNRATALSTLNFIVLVPFSLVLIFSGNYIENTSANIFAGILGIVIFILLLFIGLFYAVGKKLELPKTSTKTLI